MCSDLGSRGMAPYLTNDGLILTFPTIARESGSTPPPPLWDIDPPKEDEDDEDEDDEDEEKRDTTLSQFPAVVVVVAGPASRPKKERATLLSESLQSPQRKNENSQSTRS
jgi:hypothetical protein